jgi:3-hydroxyisobutyrate dehydrogenase-like beta-hydroxyacid dehydrogenase
VNPAQAVGVVGLGLVGRALAGRLMAAGHRCVGFDASAAACEAFAAQGGTVAADLATLGRQVATVVLAVYDTAGVLQVVEGGAAQPGLAGTGVQALVDCSTGEPEQVAALSQRLALRGIDYIEAPLSGSSAQIAAGEATLLTAGTDAALARADALLTCLSPQRIHVGAAGMGARAKLASNLVLGLNRAALAEGFAFAQAMGIAPAQFLQLVLATPARSAAAEVKGPKMVAGDFQPDSRIRQHLKDLDLMLAAAGQAGQALPFTTTHAGLLRRAVEAGDGELDNAAILRQIQREAPAGAMRRQT